MALLIVLHEAHTMKPITKSLLWLFSLGLLNGVLAYAVRLLFARHLSLADYGLFYAVFSFVFFFVPFRSFGLPEASIFYLSKFSHNEQHDAAKGVMFAALLPQVLLALLIGAAILIVKPLLVGYYFRDPASGALLDILVVLLFFDTFLVWLGTLFLARQKMVLYKIGDTVKFGLIAFLAYAFFESFPKHALVPALLFLVGTTLALTVNLMFFFFTFPKIIKAKSRISRETVRGMLVYASQITLATAVALIITYSDTFLLTIFRGVDEVGLYNVAYPSAFIILGFVSSGTVLLFSKMAGMYHAGRQAEITAAIQFVYENVLIIALPLAFSFLAYADLIIKILFGESYLAAAPGFRIFSVVVLFMILWDINGNILAGIGNTKERTRAIIAGSVLNLLAGLILIPLLGATGAAISTGIGFATLAVLSTFIILRRYPVRLDFSEQFRILLAALLFIGSIFLLKGVLDMNVWAKLAIVLGVSGLVYLGALVLFGVLTKGKALFVRQMFF